MTTKTYAGIGSRQTPANVQHYMSIIAKAMAEEGYTLRSGGANGADAAFEGGCNMASGPKEIYLPWPGFNGSSSQLCQPSLDAYAMAETFHPNWRALSEGGQKLMARNAHQLFGKELNEPVELVICWTLNGYLSGGTAQAIRMAQAYGIPVVNLGSIKGELLIEAVKAINQIIDPTGAAA